MKNYLLIAFCLILIIASLCNASALYKGTLNVNVGQSVSVNIGTPPSFNVTNSTGTTGQTQHFSSSGGGGGSGISTISSQITTNSLRCIENWQCGSWGACNNQVQTRTCTDTNNCGTTTNMPSLSEACTSETISSTDFLTGAITGIKDFVKTGDGIATLLILIITVILGITLITLRRSRLIKTNKSESSEIKHEV